LREVPQAGLCQIVAFMAVLLMLPDRRAHIPRAASRPQLDDYHFHRTSRLAVASKLQ
jgi:hypothetical protein